MSLIQPIVVYGHDESYIELMRLRNPTRPVKWVVGGKTLIFPPITPTPLPEKETAPSELTAIPSYERSEEEQEAIEEKKGGFPWWIVLLAMEGAGIYLLDRQTKKRK